jgi:hypothetical protein
VPNVLRYVNPIKVSEMGKDLVALSNIAVRKMDELMTPSNSAAAHEKVQTFCRSLLPDVSMLLCQQEIDPRVYRVLRAIVEGANNGE